MNYSKDGTEKRLKELRDGLANVGFEFNPPPDKRLAEAGFGSQYDPGRAVWVTNDVGGTASVQINVDAKRGNGSITTSSISVYGTICGTRFEATLSEVLGGKNKAAPLNDFVKERLAEQSRRKQAGQSVKPFGQDVEITTAEPAWGVATQEPGITFPAVSPAERRTGGSITQPTGGRTGTRAAMSLDR